MKHLVAISIAVLCIAVAYAITRPAPASAPSNPDTRVIYVIRHADTQPGQNPELSEAGAARAERLAQTLAHEQLAAIFVTDTTRSRQTGAPTALNQGVEPQTYPATDAAALRGLLDTLPPGTNALVIAHSNTVSTILEALGGPSIGDLPHDEFSRFYALVLTNGEHTRTLQLAY